MIFRKILSNRKTMAMTLIFVLVAALLTACLPQITSPATNTEIAGNASGSAPSATSENATLAEKTSVTPITVNFDSEDTNSTWLKSTSTQVDLQGSTIGLSGSGATLSGTTVTISSPGTYVFTGTLDDGQIVVNSASDGIVRLVLNGASIHCESSSPVYVQEAERVVLILADETVNTLTDGTTYTLPDAESNESNEPNATIFSKADLTINGLGTLNIDANYKQGIISKDELKIVSGTIHVESATDGITGRDLVAVRNATLSINAVEDGLRSNNDEDSAKGLVYIESGTITIAAGNDGIQGETQVLVTGGDLNITSGGGSANSINGQADNNGNFPIHRTAATATTTATATATSTESMKAIKAGTAITLTGGTFVLDSAEDAIHSNSSIVISGGSFSIKAGDDAVHANTSLTVNDGDMTVLQSYEGLESLNILINGGTINVQSSDDGINIAGGADGSSVNGRPGQNAFSGTGSGSLLIKGGTITVDASGDGLDINGSINMSGGTVLVNGPIENMNAAIDYDWTFTMTGGYLVAAGSSGMAQAPGTESSVHSLLINLDSTNPAGTLINISDEDGQSIATFAPAKTFQSIVVASVDITDGKNYTVSIGGQSSGTLNGRIYSGGVYSGGTELATLTVSSIVTTYGTPSGMGGGRGGAMRPGRG